MSTWAAQFWALFKKELLLEWRQKYAFGGILLFVVSTVFLAFIAFFNSQVAPIVWNVLFWLIILFACVNAIAKSFVQESGNRQLYYYSLADPLAVLFSKMLYNYLLLLLLALLTFALFTGTIGNPLVKLPRFLAVLALGCLGLSIVFTFISAISVKGKNSVTLMAILGFPVIIPTLLLLIRSTNDALGLVDIENFHKDLFLLSGIDLILIAISTVLFPYLWRE